VGTWGEGAFDNDTAADWAWEFDGADRATGLTLIDDALTRAAATPVTGYLRGRDGDLAVAAAELVAYIAGQATAESPYNNSARQWADRVAAPAEPHLIGLALRALARVTGNNSELASLWDEVPSTWRASIAELTARLLAASPEPASLQTSQELLPRHIYQSAVRALAAISQADIPGIYAVSFLLSDQDDDPRQPLLTIGYNTEAQIHNVLTQPAGPYFGRPADEAEARWNYAFWLQNELAVIGHTTRDPAGATLIQTWIKASGLWCPEPASTADEDWAEADAAAEQIDDYVTDLYVRTARQLHADGVINHTFGRSIPILIHELEYPDWVADLTDDANPPGLASAFTTWVRALGD
jgi:hypothetical protein